MRKKTRFFIKLFSPSLLVFACVHVPYIVQHLAYMISCYLVERVQNECTCSTTMKFLFVLFSLTLKFLVFIVCYKYTTDQKFKRQLIPELSTFSLPIAILHYWPVRRIGGALIAVDNECVSCSSHTRRALSVIDCLLRS